MNLLTKLNTHYQKCRICTKATSTEAMCEKMLLFKEHPKKEDVVLDYTEHQSICPPCKIAHSSDMYCRPMRAYVDSGIATYQRELPVETEELTALAEQHHLNNQGAETKHYEALARLLSLDELTTRQRECIQLHFWEGLTERDIAEKLNIAPPVVHRHIKAGIVALRTKYDQHDEHVYDKRGQKIDIIHVFRYAVSNFIFKRAQDMGMEATG